jgi:hypothetical protein
LWGNGNMKTIGKIPRDMDNEIQVKIGEYKKIEGE